MPERTVVSSLGGRGLACTHSPRPVGGDGSQAADQVMTEGAKLRQRQVGRHLDIIVTMETRVQVQTVALIQGAAAAELNRLLHLQHRDTQSTVSLEQPITVRHQRTGNAENGG